MKLKIESDVLLLFNDTTLWPISHGFYKAMCRLANMLIVIAWGTFDDESLGQQSQVVDGLLILCQFLDADPGTHALRVPVPAVDIVDLGHQQQSLVQVPGLEVDRGGKTGFRDECFIWLKMFFN